ncbi:MAG: Potassium channel, inwardly rectifying, Kir [Gemmatimonadetes bacterium]|nr:Potassium channel, inwardly rectifying, Kir [Gemmatimonadota bacterium]
MTSPSRNDDGAPPPATRPTDLGFGQVVAQAVRGRFLNRDGRPNSKKYGLGAQRMARLYLGALETSWPSFVGWLMGVLLLINGCFALGYLALGAGALRGTELLGLDDPFLRAFSFSVGVFTTTGSAPMYAYGATAHWLANLESFVGPVTLVVAFGLVIARLTRPRMRLGFSESAIIAPYEGGRGVMFRLVNLQPSELSDVQARVNLVRFEEIDGVRQRNFHELTLERNSVEFFTLHWTVVHPITADSPLAGVTPESLAASQAEFLIVVSALEETFSTRVSTRSSYLWDEVRWDVKFASIFANGPDGVIAIDVERLSRTERLEEGATRVPAALELPSPAAATT